MLQLSEVPNCVPELRKDDAQPKIFAVPDTMRDWPWPRILNPHYEEVVYESNAWLRSFKLLDERSQYAFDLCDFGRLASLVYPHASREHLRIGVDLISNLFLIDEYTDVKPRPIVEEIIEIIIDAIRNPRNPRPVGELALGEIWRRFWAFCEKIATPEAAKHFVESLMDYLRSVIIEADNRDRSVIQTVEEYLETRRENSAVRAAFMPVQLDLSIPDYIYYHPTMRKLEYLIVDLIIIDNDIASYNREQATGIDQYNILTIVMRQFNLNLEDAIIWAAYYHKEVEAKFFDILKNTPSWGKDNDDLVSVYIERIAYWPRGNYCWNFESRRYFGSRGAEIETTRSVTLLERRETPTRLRKEDIEIFVVDSQ